MQRIGLENVQLIETPGNPVVYADWLHAAGAPTILFYGHYDVQPVDPVELWESPPFEATVRDGEIYARGAADDKGQVFMHLKAIEAFLKQTSRLPVNIRLIIEGEEEVGSAHLDDFVRDNRDMLKADVVVISDSAMFDRGVPSICYSLRGLIYFQIDVRGTTSDLHSGVFGGAVANPAMVLAQVLAQMKDRSGHIRIPGFYDDVLALSDEERNAWKALPFNEKKYRKDLGRAEVVWRVGLHDARTRVGAADVRGQRPAEWFYRRGRQDRHSGHRDGEGQHAAGARSGSGPDRGGVRGVPEEGHAQDGGPEGDAHARRSSVDHRATTTRSCRPRAGRSSRGSAKRRSFVAKADPFRWSRPFRSSSVCPPCSSAWACPDENAHAPNERLDLGNFHNGIVASAYLYDEICTSRSPARPLLTARLRTSATRPGSERIRQN